MPDMGSVRDFPVGPFADAVNAWFAADTPRPATEPHPAATVLLLRGSPLEVFMIERAASMLFAPSTWVFPGGRVDPSDSDILAVASTSRADDERVERMASRLDVSTEAVKAWVVAGIRELFEEAGVLLASDAPGGEPIAAIGEPWRSRRAQLELHEMSFQEVLSGLNVRLDLVEPVDRWITPPFEQRRYDTLFVLAALPAGAVADAVSREAQQGGWKRPEEMLAAADRGELRLLPPTRTRLASLLNHDDAHAALAVARDGGEIRATCPWPVQGVDGPHLRAEVNP